MVLAAAAMSAGMWAENYKIIVPMSGDDEGAMVRLIDYDKGVAIDSVLVADEKAVFKGEIDEPVLARLTVDGQRMPIFILESGTISFNRQNGAFGTMLNDQFRKLNSDVNAIGAAMQNATQEQREALMARYTAMCDSVINANMDNALGYFVFMNTEDLSSKSLSELEEVFKKYPAFASYQRSARMIESARVREATQPGGKFVDFSITQPDGTVKKLSDYVAKGKYTLVDFWASWCGPCIRQTAVLKDIYNKYKDDGRLEVLGVAVWDKVDDTRRAIEQHQLPWECILDGQTIPTDLYGITGIPCIILFGPDGTILSRDKQDDDLRNDVDKALNK